MVFVVDTRWRREWRFRGGSLSISFSYNIHRTRISGGSMHLYLGRLTLEWQVDARGGSARAHWSKKIKPLDQWTAAEKREMGIVDVGKAS